MEVKSRREQIAQLIRDALALPCPARSRVLRLVRSAADELPAPPQLPQPPLDTAA